jgi:glycosyltransferase involved in cell wall biosynthesis
MLVAVLAPSYGLERVSYMIPSTQHRYIKLHRVPIHRLERGGTFFEQTPLVVGPQVDLVHTFNHIPVNRQFVVTAEMELPRYLGQARIWQKRAGLRLLASDRCRGIWPLSEATRSYLARRFDDVGFGQLKAKMSVFRGAVPSGEVRGAEADCRASGPLKLLFVGADGLRKGLRPTIEAALALRKAGLDVELTVVGNPTAETYLLPGLTFPIADLSAMLAESPWIRHYPSLPNIEVRRLMDNHDLFVLPTIDESLGWVMAEAAMSGLPSITTNIFAIPELVLDGVTGWTIDLTLDEDRRWIGVGRPRGEEAWIAVQAFITERLIAVVSSLAADRSAIKRFGEKARQHMSAQYAMDVAGPRLESLYSAALGS